ncbi:unannotated protein [freshwater metagenome]
MFPLGKAFLPGSLLMVQIFEPRYRVLVHDCLEMTEPEFGVVMIERGSEVGGGDTRSPVGAVARLLRVEELQNGRISVVAGIGRRILVQQWLPDNPYPYASVEDWPDEGLAVVDPVLLGSVSDRCRRSAELAAALGDPGVDPTVMISDDPSLATFQLAGLAPLSDFDRYRVLCGPGAGDRLAVLAELLETVEDVLTFRMQR